MAGRDYIPIMEALTTVQTWLRHNGYGQIVNTRSVGGGCINDSMQLETSGGQTVFLKQHAAAPPRFFQSEAAGLQAMESIGSLPVPAVIHADNDFLLLENLGRGLPGGDYWESLGRGLAAMHARVFPAFGFDMNNYCGLTPQNNPLTADGFTFFSEHRLLALGRLAGEQLSARDFRQLETIAVNLDHWIPEQPAVLIHGDLWSGNVHCNARGQPALLDPACYYGWPEADLAMTLLFGGFGPGFYSSYEEASGIDRNWRERVPLYNLYHLLNHLHLFGGAYLDDVQAVLRRFGR
ncbi:MAG: fructosamine kinase family protein [Pseudohongiellaceae bacterium]